jgi:hypothetical protein
MLHPSTPAALAALALSSLAGHAQTLTFSDQAANAGLIAPHQPVVVGAGVEFMSGGGAVGDFNNDGYPDIFVTGGSAGVDRLFINQGDGTFVDQAPAWGVDRTHAGSGACAGDFNNDGLLDLYVTSLGVAGDMTGNTNILYRNNGDNTFTDVAAAAGVQVNVEPGVPLGDPFGAAFGDYDLDGDLDLAVAGWLGGNRLFRNDGNGAFTDVTTTAIDVDMTQVRGFAPAFVDTNDDRYPELLWVSDFYTSKFLVNNTDGTFTDHTLSAGVGLDSNGMGNAHADFNADGLIDWHVTSRINQDETSGSGNMHYINLGANVFLEDSVAAGVHHGEWSWGADARDFNHDGRPDLLVTNGFSGPYYENDPTHLFLNIDGATFTDVAPTTGLNHTAQGRGVATLDADLDGDMDILIFCNADNLAYYENKLTGPNTNWITLALDTSGIPALAPHGFGTKVVVTTDTQTITLDMAGGSNFNATSELVVHTGVADATSLRLDITWTDGSTLTLDHVQPNRRYTITARTDCAADLVVDNTLDFADIVAFLTEFGAHHPQADLVNDGAFDFTDVAAFLAAFGAGCN